MFSKEYKIHYKINWGIAYPLVLGQAGHMITSIADTIMVGQLGSLQLAAASVAHNVFILVFVFGLGISYATTTIVGKAYGERNTELLQSIFFNGLFATIGFGILLTTLMYLITYLFPYLQQKQEVIELAVPYYKILVLSWLPYFIFMHYKQFVDGLTKTKPGMIIILVCNVVNVILNYGLIFGKLGMPKMGLNGAAVATVIARSLMAICFILLMRYSKSLSIYLKKVSIKYLSFERIKEFFKLGLPIGVQHILEVGAFVVGALMTGWLGAKQLAAYQIVISLASLTFLMSSGVSSTATIRISNLLGERKYHRLRIAGFSAFYMVLTFMSICGVLFIIGRYAIPSIYINEPDVIKIAAQLMIIAGLFQIMDGTQVTALGALRGLQDVNYPTLISLLSYWIITLPFAYFLGIYLNYGVNGIWWGYLIGLFFAAVILTCRFLYLLKRINKQLIFNYSS
ncbi:MAG: MATE family efflux transporter [Ignavibacteria bacterium]|nr:MATE family efflux transporter [Ignavibacteria bacterium]